MKADLPLHSTGVLFLHTGINTAGRPSLGSWVNYGLGSENRNLPGFVVLSFGVVPCGGLENYSSGFLPANHQATLFHAEGAPIDNIRPPIAQPLTGHGSPVLDLLRDQDADFARSTGGPSAIDSAIRNYELAYRMQSLVPDVLDLARESQATRRLYGIDSSIASKRLYGIQCLRARRLVESGVRFVEITCPPGASNGTWDQHGNLERGYEEERFRHRSGDRRPDQGFEKRAACSMKDARPSGPAVFPACTPHSAGRDQWPRSIIRKASRSGWPAAAFKGGVVHGATDDFRHARRARYLHDARFAPPRSCTCWASIMNG